MINTHTCLDGEDRLGPELDCPHCRAGLLEAFRTSPDAPEAPESPREAAVRRHPSGSLPHLQVPPESARTVPFPDRESEPFTDEQQEPEIHTHTTEHGAEPDPFADDGSGDWFARCSCGWSDGGHYARPAGLPVAARLAKLRAQKHREDTAR